LGVAVVLVVVAAATVAALPVVQHCTLLDLLDQFAVAFGYTLPAAHPV